MLLVFGLLTTLLNYFPYKIENIFRWLNEFLLNNRISIYRPNHKSHHRIRRHSHQIRSYRQCHRKRISH